jgi:putative copper export protein
MFGGVLGYGFIAVLALVLFLTFAASGVTWLIATAVPGTDETRRRQLALVAVVSGAILAVVLFLGALLAPARPPGPLFRGPRPPIPGQQQPQPQPGLPQASPTR